MKTSNLFSTDRLPGSHTEVFEKLLEGRQFRLERIVSTGQCTPKDQWYDQDQDEWVVLLAGGARLRMLRAGNPQPPRQERCAQGGGQERAGGEDHLAVSHDAPGVLR